MDFIINILAFIVVISIVVFIHEFGHYLLARLNGVKIDSFSIGFGKEIFGLTDKSGTRWSISCIPFGGYVKMFGDSDASSSSKNIKLIESISEDDKKKCLQFKPPLAKISVALAGPLFNFLLSIVILIPIYNTKGITIVKPVVSEIIKNSPAEKSEFKIGDEILEIDNKEIKTFDDIQLFATLNVNSSMKFKIKREGSIIYKDILPITVTKKDVFGNEIKTNFIGISSNNFEFRKLSFFNSVIESFKTVYNICKTSLIAIWQMITLKRNVDGLSGPIKIAKYSGQYFKNGFVDALTFIVLISTSLGLMNLLPIPILDGGLVFLCLIELISRRELSDKCEKYASILGYGVLFVLMVFSTAKDIKDVIFK